MNPSRRPIRIAMLRVILAVLGLGLSAELTRIHVLVHTDPSYHPLCDAGGQARCGSIALSPDSVFAGAPVSAWGVLAYLTLLGLALAALRRVPAGGSRLAGSILLLSFLACLVSLRLAWVSAFRIDAVCVYCTILHLLNAALLLLSVLDLEASGSGVVQALREDLREAVSRPRAVLVALATVLGTAALIGAGWPAYWRLPDLGGSGLDRGVTAEGEPWIGARDPKVTIVEFTDYECPYCRLEHRRIRQLVSRHPDRVRLVHRHFPLDAACHPGLERPFHRHACRFAFFAECAARRGLFWEANDALIRELEQRRPERVRLEDLAVRIGLPAKILRECIEGGDAGKRIERDIREGIRLGVNGTPTYLVNGVLQEGTLSEAALSAFLSAGKPAP